MPGEFDRYNMKRIGEPDGQHRRRGPGPGRRPRRAGDRSGPAPRPRGRPSTIRGQIRPDGGDPPRPGRSAWGCRSSSSCCLLTANFQSVRLALVVVSTTPAVVAGVVADALADRDDDQPPVVHGGDHGHRRGGGQRHPAGHLRRGDIAARKAPTRTRPRSRAPGAGCGRSS